MSFDEDTIRCKGHTSARSCVKSRLSRFGIRLYANVGWNSGYLYSIADNNSGNKTGISPTKSYLNVFQILRNIMSRKPDARLTSPHSASELCALQVAHGLQVEQTKEAGMVVMDNFYSQPDLREQIRKLTDDWVRILWTVRLNNLDLINRVNVKQAVEAMKDASRGNCYLCRTYLLIAPTTRRRGAPCCKVISATVADSCGFIFWKYCNIETFYSNDLA